MKPKQTEIAEALNVSQPVISKWSRGKSRPRGLFLKAVQEKMPELLQKWAEKYPELYQEEAKDE